MVLIDFFIDLIDGFKDLCALNIFEALTRGEYLAKNRAKKIGNGKLKQVMWDDMMLGLRSVLGFAGFMDDRFGPLTLIFQVCIGRKRPRSTSRCFQHT